MNNMATLTQYLGDRQKDGGLNYIRRPVDRQMSAKANNLIPAILAMQSYISKLV